MSGDATVGGEARREFDERTNVGKSPVSSWEGIQDGARVKFALLALPGAIVVTRSCRQGDAQFHTTAHITSQADIRSEGEAALMLHVGPSMQTAILGQVRFEESNPVRVIRLTGQAVTWFRAISDSLSRFANLPATPLRLENTPLT